MSTIPTQAGGKKKDITYSIPAADTYPARQVKFVGLGVQPPFDDKDEPRFKARIGFELIGVSVTKTVKDPDSGEIESQEEIPAVMYWTPNIVAFGGDRSSSLKLAKCFDASLTKAPADIEWYSEKNGHPLMVTVTHKNKKQSGELYAKVESVSAMPAMFAKGLDPAQTEFVSFDPYEDNEIMLHNYNNKLSNFERKLLEEATDATNIPYAGREPVREEGEAPKKPEAVQGGQAPAQEPAPQDFDDDIPF